MRLLLRLNIIVFLVLVSARAGAQIQEMSNKEFTEYLLETIDSSGHYTIDFTKKISPERAVADLQILKKVLEETHTPIYRYATKNTVDSMFRQAIAEARDSISYHQFIGSIARIQNTIACGHSGWGHSKDFVAYRSANIGLFPIDIKIADGRFYILRDNTIEQSIPPNAEIVAINNVGVDSISRILQQHMYRDGAAPDNTAYDIERNFSNAYSNFIDNPDEFDITIRSDNEKAHVNYHIKPLLKNTIDSIRSERHADAADASDDMSPPLRFIIADSINTGVYTIKWFNDEYIREQGQDFEAFTDSVFATLSRDSITNLVIDLRDNAGGWTHHGLYLFSYFIDRVVPYIETVEVKKYKDYSFAPIVMSEAGYSDTFNLVRKPDGRYLWQNNPNLIAKPQRHNRYQGYVYILTNAGTRSCSGIFSSLMKEHTEAVFVGAATGTAQCGTGGMVMAVRLPHTGVSIYFTTAEYTCAVSNKEDSKGVMPDISVSESFGDRQQQEDTVLNKVIQVIKER